MSSPVGLSASDIFKAIEVVHVVVDALRRESRSGASYCNLIAQLRSLETALILVNGLETNTEQYAQVAALHQAASQCRHTIDAFLKEVSSYQPHLGGTSGNLGIKAVWYKVKWSLCKKEDLEKFQVALISHTGSINAPLQFVQTERQDHMHKSLAGMIQDVSVRWLSSLSPIANGMNQALRQGQKLPSIAVMIHKTNLRVFRMVVDIHQVVLSIPAQVHRQKPIVMTDPLGRISPFHLEFIRSKEALLAVLQDNLKSTRVGPMMIQDGNFSIRDNETKRDIRLDDDWNNVFHPGQSVSVWIQLHLRANFHPSYLKDEGYPLIVEPESITVVYVDLLRIGRSLSKITCCILS
ncbi:hypothetical protein LIA77_07264 [Sarocladium implicatum]|nr:hypothetical protein LIA77_07264 [Sarocladium implicatum]